jgi:uncharacterized protein YecE (DUF72 family)
MGGKIMLEWDDKKLQKKLSKYRPCLRIGTCSWKYDSWKGLIYEPEKEYHLYDYLPDYARYFNTVEIDQWFWSLFAKGVKLPEPDTVKAYADSVPDDFRFTIKVPNSITLTNYYTKQPSDSKDLANSPNPHFLDVKLFKRFLETLEPMKKKLGPLMFQFEYLNKQKMPSKEAFLDRLDEFFQKAPKGYEYAIEPRNPNYLKDNFFDFFKTHNLGFVLIEGYYMPHIADLTAEHDIVTADYSIIRLHGLDRQEIEERTGGKWNDITNPKDEGLKATASIIKANTKRGIKTYLNINNHYEGSAPLTIERFLKLL